MKVFVTGGRGMLGGALLRAFRALAPSAEVVAPTRETLDLVRRDEVESFFLSHRFDAVVHCAAKVGGIHANIADPTGFLAENLYVDMNVLGAAQRSGVETLLYFGSSCMYPRNRDHALREEDLLSGELEPTNEGYALAKIAGGKYSEYIARQHGLTYRCFIPPNLYGIGDHFEPNRSHLVAACIAKIHWAKIQGEKTVSIWGDGTARREFLFVDDVARFAVESLPRLSSFPAFANVGYGRDHTVLEYYEMAARAIGYEGQFVTEPDRPAGMRRKLMDSSRAEQLGWTPTTTIDDGILKTYEHFKQQQDTRK